MRMAENHLQVSKIVSLQGLPGIWYATNYQYQSTVFGI